MADILVRVQDIKGLTPAVDPRRTDSVQLVDAQNVFFTSDGIISGFGSTLLYDRVMEDGRFAQGLRVAVPEGTLTFTFTNTCMYQWDEAVGTMVPLYYYASIANTPYRWSHGYVNGVLYLCHPAIGILAYRVSTGTVALAQGTAIPESPLYITEDNGRLIVIDRYYYYWSAQSDGTNFRAASGAGGTQLIGDRMSGLPIAVLSYGKGTITLTTSGFMRSDFTGDSAVYRHRAVNTEYVPVNSFCIFKTVEDQIVFLDRRGLFVTTGDKPSPFTPLWNEFLIQHLKTHRFTELQNARLEWDKNNRLLYISLSESDIEAKYDLAYALYPPMDKWGVFSETHWGILPVTIASGVRRGDFFAYVGEDLRIRYWSGAPYQAGVAGAAGTDYWKPDVQYGVAWSADKQSRRMASTLNVNTISEQPTYSLQGFYRTDYTAQPFTLLSLDAYATVGLFRFGEARNVDELSHVYDVTIGSYVSTDGLTDVTDFNLVDPCIVGAIASQALATYCWQGAASDFDFSFGSSRYADYNAELISSLDGRTALTEGAMAIRLSTQGLRYYSSGGFGLYHSVKISAETAGQVFHIRSLELGGTLSGGL